MKKLLFTIFVICSLSSSAQVYDTVTGRHPLYHYTAWYDTCRLFLDSGYGSDNCLGMFYAYVHPNYFMRKDYTPDTLMVRGLSCMVASTLRDRCYLRDWLLSRDHGPRLPEHLYLCKWDEKTDTLQIIDSVRWDTVTPYVCKLPKHIDTATYGFEYCYGYNAYFDHPIPVTDSFYIVGSDVSNMREDAFFHNYPTFYVSMGLALNPVSLHCSQMLDIDNITWISNSINSGWSNYRPYSANMYQSPFHAIVQPKRHVEAVAEDAQQGRVLGGGDKYDSTYITLTAVPSTGYWFSHWDDGDTCNPRQVLVVSDTAFVAHFTPKAVFKLATTTSYPLITNVLGGGLYYDRDTAVITAVPSVGMKFVSWNDGDTSNPRQVVVTQDTVFMANFKLSMPLGIDAAEDNMFTISPNPARDYVDVECGTVSSGAVTIRDAAGREVAQAKLRNSRTRISIRKLPVGTYFVTLVSSAGTSTQKLVVE